MTPEQAKFLLSVFLPAIRREFPTTLRVIQAVPTDKGDYRPAPNSRSALELAWHLASADIWFLDGFLAGEFDMEDDTMPADFSNSAGYRRQLRRQHAGQARQDREGCPLNFGPHHFPSSESTIYRL